LKKEVNSSDIISGDKSGHWKELDVSILHALILEEIFRIGASTDLSYIIDTEQAINEVDSDNYQLVFFLNPTRIEQILQIASYKEKMPNKSTYFYPKPLSGIVMNHLF
jgi:uncharacterized protein (DUF1015 family)